MCIRRLGMRNEELPVSGAGRKLGETLLQAFPMADDISAETFGRLHDKAGTERKDALQDVLLVECMVGKFDFENAFAFDDGFVVVLETCSKADYGVAAIAVVQLEEGDFFLSCEEGGELFLDC